ncbi:MAG TPA: VOC family protein [Nocardioidaceae bacterium]|jgi:hypothetical protein
MSEREHYDPGLPCWIDLGTPDVDAAAAFYSGLFGWDFEETSPASGDYRMAVLKGRRVAGLGPAQAEGVPWWTTYFSVNDASAAAAATEANGGGVIDPAQDVAGVGSMAVLADPEGATFSVWQPGAHFGAGLRDEHGTLGWTELMTRDIETARKFYAAVLGWESEDYPMGAFTYTVWNVGESNAAGGMPMSPEQFPDEVPSHWMVYFEVDDCDATAVKVAELGGSIAHPPTDIPQVGRFAVCNGPTGEVFSIIHAVGPSS